MKLFNLRILFVILTYMAIVNVSAQNYSELDLFGKWNLVQRNGYYDQTRFYYELPKINNINCLYFKDISICVGDSKSTMYEASYETYSGHVSFFKDGYSNTFLNYNIRQSFITNGNILHIDCCTYGSSIVLRFIILSLSNDRLELSTLDNTCVLIFEKENSSSNVRSLHEETEVSSDYFNLQGIQLESQPQSGIYLKKGKGDKVKKVIGSKGAK